MIRMSVCSRQEVVRAGICTASALLHRLAHAFNLNHGTGKIVTLLWNAGDESRLGVDEV